MVFRKIKARITLVSYRFQDLTRQSLQSLMGIQGFAAFGCAKPVAWGFPGNNRGVFPCIFPGTYRHGGLNSDLACFSGVWFNKLGHSGVSPAPIYSSVPAGTHTNHSTFVPRLPGNFLRTTGGNDHI